MAHQSRPVLRVMIRFKEPGFAWMLLKAKTMKLILFKQATARNE
ncbi:hypothetical protein [Gimesia sp.]